MSTLDRARLGLVWFALLFGPLAFGVVEPWSVAVLQGALLLLALLTLRSPATLPDNAVYRTALPCLLFLLVLGAVQRLNPRPFEAPSALFPFTASAEGTNRLLLLGAAYASFLWAAPVALESSRSAHRLLWAVFVLGAVIAVLGMVQLAGGNKLMYGLRAVDVLRRNPFGPYYNHNHGAAMLVMSAFVGAGLFAAQARRWEEFRREGRAGEFAGGLAFSALLLGVVLCGIVMAASRGAAMAMLVAAMLAGFGAIFFRLRGVAARGAAAAAFLGLCGAGVFIAGSKALKSADTAIIDRLSIYRSSVAMIADFPVFGAGLGAVEAVFPAYQENMVQGRVDHLHNDYLELLFQFGFVGFAAWAAAFAGFCMKAGAAYRRALSGESRCLRAGCAAGLAAYLLHSLLDFNAFIPANLLLALALAVVAGRGASMHANPVR